MNDKGYEKIEFKGSINEQSIKNGDKYNLLCAKPYYEGAIMFHTREKNPHQIKFFTQGLNLIKMKKLSKKTMEILENNGFNVGEIMEQNGEYYIEIRQFTPVGEDWWETIWFDGTDDGLFKAIEDRWDSFNADDEAAIWIEGRGKMECQIALEH